MASRFSTVAGGGGGTDWRCENCRRCLGSISGTTVLIHHQRRRIIASMPVIQQCDRCGVINTIGAIAYWPALVDEAALAFEVEDHALTEARR